ENVDMIQVRVEHHGGPSTIFDNNCCSLEVDGLGNTRFLFWNASMSSIHQWPYEMKAESAFWMAIPKDTLVTDLAGKSLGETARIRAVVTNALLKEFRSDWQSLPLTT